MTDPKAITTYSLFGENTELADLLHIESIETRSSLHDWSLTPHRHARLHQILALTQGGGLTTLDGIEQDLHSPCMINIPRGAVHGFRFSSDTRGWVLTLTSDLMDQVLGDSSDIRTTLDRAAVTPLRDNLLRLITAIRDASGADGFARTAILRGLVGAVTGTVAQYIGAQQSRDANPKAHQLFARFETLVNRDFRARRQVSDYARELAVSTTHLNRISHQATGQSASQLINERMLREARRLLIYTTLSAAQIAYELGYADPAHFSRVFARGTGLPPRRFRRHVTAGGLPPE
ncbi:transcriptional regulator, AraC family [Phaeobacter piscinae]|uniref:Transcriptional regulator, AraC family n=1 Tax=Phaeobacter piscinae TaxID=1580596 RepID=A0AAN1GN76_9RHOB|nr:helix-turn-helix domain-containing protein [Phaeobacter piscinae]ATG42157.1 transcriptional regulator, AraC family [Phaeobacter piscinae]AUQ75682.1 transcriptional regulator, AraC family [Phaeobacter piscinae]AUR34490.1 transcriptional regulator, AraC family [Phaeobacter piscinae]